MPETKGFPRRRRKVFNENDRPQHDSSLEMLLIAGVIILSFMFAAHYGAKNHVGPWHITSSHGSMYEQLNTR